MPQTGTQLLETFLDHPELQPGMRYELRDLFQTIKRKPVEQNKALYSRMWKQFQQLEHEAYEKINDSMPFQVPTPDSLEDIGPCR